MAGRKIKKRIGFQAQTLTEARMQKGYSQQRISDLAGMNIRQYQRIEVGERPFHVLSMKQGLRICEELGIDPYLLTFVEPGSQRRREAERKHQEE